MTLSGIKIYLHLKPHYTFSTSAYPLFAGIKKILQLIFVYHDCRVFYCPCPPRCSSPRCVEEELVKLNRFMGASFLTL